MKKIFASVLALMLGAAAANAQYLCADKGTVFSYTETSKDDKDKEVTSQFKTTVTDVTTDDKGRVTSVYETVHKVEGKEFLEVKTTSSFTFNPTDNVTTYTMMTGEEFMEIILKSMVDALTEAGQYITDAQMNELKETIRVKGELTMPLPAEIDPAAKVPNKSIKLFMGPNTVTTSLWEVKYAGIEDVTVPAGTYKDCLKVTYVMKQASPDGNVKTNCASWFAKGLGEVKCENYDKKGNVNLTQVLVSVDKE